MEQAGEPQPSISPVVTQRSPLLRLASYFRPWGKLLALALPIMVAAAALGPYLMTLLTPILQGAEEAAKAATGLEKVRDSAEILLWGILLKAALTIIGSYLVGYIVQQVIRTIRQRAYEHLQSLSVSYFEDQRTGSLISRVLTDTFLIQDATTFQLAGLVYLPVAIVALFGIMLFYSWRVTLVVVVLAPLMLLIIQIVGKVVRTATARAQERLGDLASTLEETITGVRTVRLFGMERLSIARFSRQNLANFAANVLAVAAGVAMSPSIDIVAIIGFVVVMLLGAEEIANGRLTPPRLITMLVLFQQIGSSLSQLGKIKVALERVSAAAERVFQVMDAPQEVADAPDAGPLERVEGEVSFKWVSFWYERGHPVLRDVSFTIRPREVVALVGASGSGKTTVASLVPRLYDPQEGRVEIDGHDVRDVTVASLRANMAIVPQETVLFAGTVRENIRFGRPDATDQETEWAAKLANAHDFISALPDGYETLVGERGVKLSGGERQRIAVARALLKDPPILILDEATSALDSESEAQVQAALEKLMERRTTLIIAHRLSTVQNAERILVLAEGTIVEQGTPHELLSREGHYRRMYELQALEGLLPISAPEGASS